MPRTRDARTPQYCRHRSTGNAYVRIDGQWFNLGKHGTPKSHAEYDRLISEWLANGRRVRVVETEIDSRLTISEVIAAYWKYAQTYYVKDGHPTSEQATLKCALRPLRHMYARTPADEFGPLALKAVRQRMIDDGYSRKYLNAQISRIKLIFRWAASEELVPATVHHGLQAVAGLKRGRTGARETEPVKPVPDEHVDAIRPYVSRQVWAIVELQRLTGMRSGEVVIMRGCDLDMTGKLWLYRPASHKTEHHGHERVVEIGPKAQAVIRPFLKPDLEAPLFSPADAEAERRAKMHAKRKIPLKYGNRPGTNRKRKPMRTPKDRYIPTSYCRAIARACGQADFAAKEQKRLPPDSERIIPRWHPHQLRHNFATAVRKQFGIEIARILLGHRSAAITEIYAEVDRTKAREIMAKIG